MVTEVAAKTKRVKRFQAYQLSLFRSESQDFVPNLKFSFPVLTTFFGAYLLALHILVY